MIEKHKVLMGYDNRGRVYDAHGRIIRKIDTHYVEQATELISFYGAYDLQKMGFVETKMLSTDPVEIVLEHHKHVISYPFEWTVSMFKAAVLFHLDLFIKLDQHGLTLKDALPNNILFDAYKPVFVDFCSLVKKDNLHKESWVYEIDGKKPKDLRFFVFEKMFIPFILIPFLLMYEKRYGVARDALFNRACNTGGKAPWWGDLVECSQGKRKELKSYLNVAQWYAKTVLWQSSDFISYCKKIYSLVVACDVMQPRSAYSSYYEIKQECFDFNNVMTWKDKQKGVYSVIKKYKPETALDLGANTGWFSMLAAHEGAQVIATDIDEGAIDLLYRQVQAQSLAILPLCMSFTDLVKQQIGLANKVEVGKEKPLVRPLFLPATERLASDLVLCLALIHHLILGQGLSVSYVMKILAALSKRVLVLEFVDLDDEKIRETPEFFKCLAQYSKSSYNLDCVVAEGKKYFRTVDIIPSHPGTRSLLVFEK